MGQELIKELNRLFHLISILGVDVTFQAFLQRIEFYGGSLQIGVFQGFD